MRQAGRYLPGYRALRAEKGGFLALVNDSNAPAEVALQPIRRFGFDGAILFSDILMVLSALGQELSFGVGEGPALSPALVDHTLAELQAAPGRLTLVHETVRRVATRLPPRTTFLGFAGSPRTVATYLVAGHGSRDQHETRRYAYADLAAFQQMIDAIVPEWAAKHLPANLPIQGNLDPLVLVAGGTKLITAADRLRRAFGDRPHVFNLARYPAGYVDRSRRAFARTSPDRIMMATLGNAYPWIKAAHLIFVIFWMAGLFMLPRFLVYHQEAAPGSVEAAVWVEREGKIRDIILTPAIVLVWVLGLVLATLGQHWGEHWLHAKLLLVLILSGYHGWAVGYARKLAAGKPTLTGKQLRMINEIPAVLVTLIVILVIVQPF